MYFVMQELAASYGGHEGLRELYELVDTLGAETLPPRQLPSPALYSLKGGNPRLEPDPDDGQIHFHDPARSLEAGIAQLPTPLNTSLPASPILLEGERRLWRVPDVYPGALLYAFRRLRPTSNVSLPDQIFKYVSRVFYPVDSDDESDDEGDDEQDVEDQADSVGGDGQEVASALLAKRPREEGGDAPGTAEEKRRRV